MDRSIRDRTIPTYALPPTDTPVVGKRDPGPRALVVAPVRNAEAPLGGWVLPPPERGQVEAMRFSEDASRLWVVRGGSAHGLYSYDLAASPPAFTRQELHEARGVTCWGIAPEGRAVVWSRRGQLRWQVPGEPESRMRELKYYADGLGFTADGTVLFASTSDGTMALEVPSGEQRWLAEVPQGAHELVAHGGTLLVDSGSSRWIFDASTGEARGREKQPPGPGIYGAVPAPGDHPGRLVQRGEQLVLQDGVTGEVVHAWAAPGAPAGTGGSYSFRTPPHAAHDAAGRRFVTKYRRDGPRGMMGRRETYGEEVSVWDLGEPRAHLDIQARAVVGLELSSHGRMLAVGTIEGDVYLVRLGPMGAS